LRFLILGLNYLPESTSIGPYTADLAEYLAQRGHQVQVVTGFPTAPQWQVWEGYRGHYFLREEMGGVPVLRTYLYVPNDPKRVRNRIMFDMSFTLSSLLAGLMTASWDLTVVISPPLQLGLTAWLWSRVKGAPYFFHIKDLVPDAAVTTGMLAENSLPVRLAYALERFIYRRARGIGVISPGFAANLEKKGVPREKISLLPDYIDLDFMHPVVRGNDFRREHGIRPDDFLVMYSGSIALKQGLHTYVEAAAACRDHHGIKFLLVGDGPYLPDLKDKARDLGLDNLLFLPLQPREGLPQQLGAADVLALTQMRAVTDIVFPGKLLYYMAAGRPILAAVSADSESGRFIQEKQVGMVVPPEDPEALAAAVRFLKENREEAVRLGDNGRRMAAARFDRQVVLLEFARHLETLAGR